MCIVLVLRLMSRDVCEEIKRRRRERCRGRQWHLLGRGRHILQWARIIHAYIIQILLTIVVSGNGRGGFGYSRGPATRGLIRFRRLPYSPVCSGCALGVVAFGMATQDVTEIQGQDFLLLSSDYGSAMPAQITSNSSRRTFGRIACDRHCIRTDVRWYLIAEDVRITTTTTTTTYPSWILTRAFVALKMLCFLEPAVTDGTLSQDHDETREAARMREEE